MQPLRAQDASIIHEKVRQERTDEDRLALAMTLVFFVGLGVVLSLPVLSHLSWLLFVQDDLLYYLEVAQNIAQGHGSTFNHLVRTNGYQPLWLIVLVGLSWMTTYPRMILAFLACSNFICALVTFLFSRKLLRLSGAGPALVFVFSAWTTLYAVTLFFYGMEVTLTVPLMLGVLCLVSHITWIERSWVHSFAFGLLLSAMVLSRIDTLIFGALLLCCIMGSGRLRRSFRVDLVLGVSAGLLPVVLYFLYNHVAFGTWLPVSGMAKELKQDHFPSIEPWRVFFHPLAATFTLLILSAVTVFAMSRKQFEPSKQAAFVATLVFPFSYFLILSCVSDWTLWGWYMYPIRAAVCVSFAILLSWQPLLLVAQRPAIRAALIASVFVCLALLRWTKQQADIYEASTEIQRFAQSHSGIYAMGDRAGRVAYLIQNPVVQTEGLMMDRDYLKYIEHQAPLREVLAHYNVRFYVATAYQPFSGCFRAVEPAKAGPHSLKMRDEFCEKPVATFFHEGIETLIFDLGQH